MHKYKLQAQRPMKFSNDNKKLKGDCGDYLRNIGSSWMKNINDLQDRKINTLVSTRNNINWVGENGNRTYRIKNFKTKIFTSLVRNQREASTTSQNNDTLFGCWETKKLCSGENKKLQVGVTRKFLPLKSN